MIRTENLTKVFRIYPRPIDRIKEALALGERVYHSKFTAVDRVDLSVSEGETVGIIGQNGSGKSTLLKILARLMTPTSGLLQVKGTVASIIELGTGFHPEFTGRSNVHLTASLLGYTREEIDEMLPDIIEFSGLANFIDRPVKTYSSGMWVRLAFSAAVAVEPQVLLVDEALSVGDMLFQQKCVSRLKKFQEKGTAVVFVSHDMGAIKTLCDRAILMDHGRKLSEGLPERIVTEYVALMAERASEQALQKRVSKDRRYGSYEAEVVEVVMRGPSGAPVEAVVTGTRVAFDVAVKRNQAAEDLSVGILLRDRLGNDVFGTNTRICNIDIPDSLESFTVRFETDLHLGPRNYYVTAAVHAGRDHLGRCYDWIDNVLGFEILPGDREFLGYVSLNPSISVLEGAYSEEAEQNSG